MYQYEFYNRSLRVGDTRPASPVPALFAKPGDIAWVRSSYWAEHCLECGEPLCYETCELFSKRPDDRCRRFSFGIYDNPHFADAPFAAEIAFRKWGKLESIVYHGSLTSEEALQGDALWKARCISKRRLMGLGALGRRIYPVEARQAFDSEKYGYADATGRGNVRDTPFFLLQLYSAETDAFTLFFDITDGDALAFREGIRISPGYNQHVVDASSAFPGKDKLRMKIYPENNREARIVLLFCELVQFAEGVAPVEYPKEQASTVGSSGADAGDAAVGGTDPQAKPAKKVKCVAWDLDNTVWDGTFVENDPNKLALRPGVLDTMKALDDRGIIQIVVSKNTESEVKPTLDRLGISDWFVALFVNWKPKSQNLKAAADLININIDTFALIDDSSFEREEVGFSLPMVRTYDENMVVVEGAGSSDVADVTGVADASRTASMAPILALPEFDVPITSESKKRRQMYKTEMQRKEESANSDGNPLDFLRSCEICAHLFHPNDDATILRSYELLQRTNQLNLSGNRYEKDVFFARMQDGKAHRLAMTCGDRFGDYGQVLYLEACESKDDPSLLVICEFALSCRVARKCVEAALAKRLLELFEPQGVRSIELRGKRTDRNGLLIDSFCAAGFSNESTDDAIVLRLASVNDLMTPDVVQITGGK